jgi:hypothetical protein
VVAVKVLEGVEGGGHADAESVGVDGNHFELVLLGGFEVDDVIRIDVDLLVDNDETGADGPTGDEVKVEGTAGGGGGGGP